MSWAVCAEGHRHWGPIGAAGLLLARDGAVLLQQRPSWAHQGGTWSTPGGAIETGESATDAALREAWEELGIDRASVVVRDSRTAACGGWTYATVLGHAVGEVDSHDRSESAAHRWVPAGDVGSLRLHPAFRTAWEHDDGVLQAFVRAT